MSIYVIDIDGTIAKTKDTDYPNSKPNFGVIAKINRMYADGHTVKLFTARGSRSGLDWRDLTEKQLNSWGVKYHELIFGKPAGDIYIDDKAVNVKDWLLQLN